MAYNSYFPAGYQPAQYFPTQQNVYPTNQNVTPPQPQNSGGFVRVQSETEARMYPVAPGNSVIFIDENAPYCYAKTVDVSQLDRPKFEKYRLVKEESEINTQPQQNISKEEYVTKKEMQVALDEIRNELKKTIPRKKKDDPEVNDRE